MVSQVIFGIILTVSIFTGLFLLTPMSSGLKKIRVTRLYNKTIKDLEELKSLVITQSYKHTKIPKYIKMELSENMKVFKEMRESLDKIIAANELTNYDKRELFKDSGDQIEMLKFEIRERDMEKST